MTRQAHIVDIFLSSPSDVDDERQFVLETARDWNSLRSKATGVFLNVLTWEDVVAPALSDRPQSVVNDAIGDEYDVYLGIMWGRFGSPTGVSESGTVEEFEGALERYRRGEGVRLAMLFKTNDIPQAQLNGAQFDKVQEFKKRYATEGGFYGEFDSDDRLRRLLNRLFEDIASAQAPPPAEPTLSGHPPQRPKRKRGTRNRDPESEEDAQQAELPAKGTTSAEDNVSDLGLFEISDRLVDVAGHQSTFFDDLTTIYLKSNAEIEAASQELENLVRFGQADESRVRPIVSAIGESIDRTAEFLEKRLPSFRDKNDDLVAVTEQGLDVSRDFGEDHPDYKSFTQSVVEVASTIGQNRTSLEGMLDSVSALPRMSTKLNRAKKRLLAIGRELRDELDHLQARLNVILARYRVDPVQKAP